MGCFFNGGEKMSWQLLQGDVRSKTKDIPDKSIQTVITSPPYWSLRSYLPDDHPDKPAEIGLEEPLEEYVHKLVEISRDVRRVLRDDGVLWLNIGDNYAGGGRANYHNSGFSVGYVEDGI